MQRSFVRTLLAFLVLPVLAAWGGDAKPGSESIKAALFDQVPAYFTIGEIAIEDQVSVGDAAAPAFKTRFSVVVSASEPLYQAATATRGVKLIRKIVDAGQKSKVYGVADAVLRGETWETRIVSLEAEWPQGKPRAPFANDVYVEGTPEAEAAIAKLAESQRQAQLRRQAAEVAAKAQAEAKLAETRAMLLGTWRGHFACGTDKLIEASAEVAFTEMSDEGDLRGTFHFFSNPGLRNGDRGQYALTGKYNMKEGELTIQPSGWIKAPAKANTWGYLERISFAGPLGSGNRQFSGTSEQRYFNGWHCQRIELEK